MDDFKIAAEQKLMLERTFAQAQAYTNLVMLAGYAGLFALWKASEKYVTPLTAFIAGILIAISLAIFVGWEIFGMRTRSKWLLRQAQLADDPERFLESIKSYQQAAADHAAMIAKRAPRVQLAAISTGVGAAAAIFSAFCHGLWLEFNGAVTPLELMMIENILSLVAGAVLACLAGLLFYDHVQKSNAKHIRRNIATSLADELRVSADLYAQTKTYWDEHGFILFLYLDEMIESRVEYQNARPHLPQVPDPDLRARIAAYYRKTAGDIDRLRQMENDRAKVQDLLERGPIELEKAKGAEKSKMEKMLLDLAEKLPRAKEAIVSKLAEFEEHRLNALHLAEKLERH